MDFEVQASLWLASFQPDPHSPQHDALKKYRGERPEQTTLPLYILYNVSITL